jgi:hypothetical protein
VSIAETIAAAFGLVIVATVLWNFRGVRNHEEGSDTWTGSTGGVDGLRAPDRD